MNRSSDSISNGDGSKPPVDSPWSLSVEETLGVLDCDQDGLTKQEAKARQEIFGSNSIADAPGESLWSVWWRQFRSLIMLLLGVAAGISVVIGDWLEAGAIAVVVILNSLIGFVTEWRAIKSIEALKKITRLSTRVVRDRTWQTVPAEALVPGDIVMLEVGDIVPADLRIVRANLLQADESSLTGESLPVSKKVDPVARGTALAERVSMLFRGTIITGGTAQGIVTATGIVSELGRISEMLAQVEEEPTPLEAQLARLGYRLIWVTLILMVLLVLAGLFTGRDLALTLQTAIALAVAAIPEGLPVVSTIALARGLLRLSKRNALINRLSAVETLGSTGIICTDKTGTLTENRMEVVAVWGVDSDSVTKPEKVGGHREREVLLCAALCNNAAKSKGQESGVGDPLEVALLEAAALAGIDVATLSDLYPRSREIPFDSGSRMMATYHRDGNSESVYVKGAPECVIPCCKGSEEKGEIWLEVNSQMAEGGLRVIAVARKPAANDEITYSCLQFLGLIGLMDPPRKDVREAIRECHNAGITVVMITGDQAPTAEAVAREVGIEPVRCISGDVVERLTDSAGAVAGKVLEANVVTRATPEQKLVLVKFFQENGQVVAMTGDGVNDAPALKQADIGIAMGLRGTDVAREAADMILRDDAFASIVAAVRHGRAIFANIRRFVAYLVSCNISEILVVAAATCFSKGLPLLPLQILFLNLVTDVFPALALGVTRSSENVLQKPPREKGEPVLRTRDWMLVSWHAILIAGSTLGAFFFAILFLEESPGEALTVSFLTLAFAQLVHVFNMLEDGEPLLACSVSRNGWVWGAIGLCLLMLAVACYQPTVAEVLNLRAPSGRDTVLISGFASVPLIVEWGRRGITRLIGKLRNRRLAA